MKIHVVLRGAAIRTVIRKVTIPFVLGKDLAVVGPTAKLARERIVNGRYIRDSKPAERVTENRTCTATKTVKRAGVSTEIPDITGLRDRAFVGVMVYTFARVNAALQMKVRDYFVQDRRGWVRLHEKGGKGTRAPLPLQS